jgi:SAM-dependent methyltransferase
MSNPSLQESLPSSSDARTLDGMKEGIWEGNKLTRHRPVLQLLQSCMASSLVQGELWGTYARDWAEVAEPTTAPLWVAILDACHVGPGMAVLDLGCGAGGLAAIAVQRGAEVTGVDAAAALVQIAGERLPHATFHVGDLESLPFETASFDVVVACNSVQFADDQGKAIAEARRVMKPGGRFAIGMWCEPERCEMGPIMRAAMSVAPPPEEVRPKPSLSARQNLIDLVEGQGFKVADEGEVQCVFEFADRMQAWQGLRSSGMMVAAARTAGEEPLKAAVVEALREFEAPAGGIRIVNRFRYLVCV